MGESLGGLIMRTIFSLLLGTAFSMVLIAPIAARAVYVPGHRTARGVYVAPHARVVPGVVVPGAIVPGVVPGAPVYRGYRAYGQPYGAPYVGQVPYGYQPQYAPGYVPGYVPNAPGYAPGYVPNAPGYVPNVPVAPYTK
jgi:hypothetical protein